MELPQAPASENSALEPGVIRLGFWQPTGRLGAAAIPASAALGFFARCFVPGSVLSLPLILLALAKDSVFPCKELIHLRRPERVQGTISPSFSKAGSRHTHTHTPTLLPQRLYLEDSSRWSFPRLGLFICLGQEGLSPRLPLYSLDGDSVPCALFSFRWNFCS